MEDIDDVHMAVSIPPELHNLMAIQELVPADGPPTRLGAANEPDGPPPTMYPGLEVGVCVVVLSGVLLSLVVCALYLCTCAECIVCIDVHMDIYIYIYMCVYIYVDK